MSLINPAQELVFRNGVVMKNRFMLAPLTNKQSHEDGSLSEDEFRWLTMRAEGQFGLVMTCASHVSDLGKGFSGQLGIQSDHLISGHQRLVSSIQKAGSLAVIQLYHGGMRSPAEIIGEAPLCPSANEKFGARTMTHKEVVQMRDDFITAAKRAQSCGYDGVELHGAHGYILAQFLSADINHRKDEYGGRLENRARIIIEIIDGVRQACGPRFLLGIRLSPERFGLEVGEIKQVAQELVNGGKIDFLDVSLWDVRKEAEDDSYKGQTLLSHFTGLHLGDVKLTVAGKIRSGADVSHILNEGVGFVTVGRSGILHHDFAKQVMENPSFEPTPIPVSKAYLEKEGIGQNFIDYLGKWPGFVGD